MTTITSSTRTTPSYSENPVSRAVNSALAAAAMSSEMASCALLDAETLVADVQREHVEQNRKEQEYYVKWDEALRQADRARSNGIATGFIAALVAGFGALASLATGGLSVMAVVALCGSLVSAAQASSTAVGGPSVLPSDLIEKLVLIVCVEAGLNEEETRQVLDLVINGVVALSPVGLVEPQAFGEFAGATARELGASEEEQAYITGVATLVAALANMVIVSNMSSSAGPLANGPSAQQMLISRTGDLQTLTGATQFTLGATNAIANGESASLQADAGQAEYAYQMQLAELGPLMDQLNFDMARFEDLMKFFQSFLSAGSSIIATDEAALRQIFTNI